MSKNDTQLSIDDPRIIWVSAEVTEVEDGSHQNPFGSIAQAVECANPGQTIVVKEGMYRGDVTIQKSGTIDKPIHIIAESGANVQCIESCWYFYDVSDFICSGIVFRESPGMSVSVIGKCMRNRFESLRFINCSIEKENSCTFFFGGSGQACNIVESCHFERFSPDAAPIDSLRKSSSVGLMIAEGDFQEGEPNRNSIINNNNFIRYGYGIILGSQDSTFGEYGHRVTHNNFDDCAYEGIVIKCGDTLVKGNRLRNCRRHSISIAAGKSSVVEDNRIIDCGYGIRVAGIGHSIGNNCIIRCRDNALGIIAATSPETIHASNIMIENNTIIQRNHPLEKENCGIRIDRETTCIIRRNLFSGPGNPYTVRNSIEMDDHNDVVISSSGQEPYFIMDNIVSGGCALADGCARQEISFVSAHLDNYTNDSGYGAQGWVLSPEAPEETEETEETEACDPDSYVDQGAISEDESETPAAADQEEPQEPEETAETDGDSVDFALRSMFFELDDESVGFTMPEQESMSDETDEQET